MVKKNNTKIIKEANIYLVEEVVRSFSKVTIEEIMHSAHLSRPTVLGILDELQERKIVCKDGFANSSGGRQAVLYTLDTTEHFSIGVDFEYPSVHLVVVNLKGIIVHEASWIHEKNTTQDQVVEMLLAEIKKALEILELQPENVVGIGIGVPGTIDKSQNMAEIVSRFPQLNFLRLKDRIEKLYAIPVYVRNDVYLMAYRSGIPKDRQLIYIGYRTGIGAAVVKNGRHEEGEYGNFGYIGHTTVDIDGEVCECGRQGCLETIASKAAVVKHYMQEKDLEEQITFDEILQRAEQGDDVAVRILKQAARYLGVAVANMIKTLDISTVVIDELNCMEDHVFFREMEQSTQEYCKSFALKDVEVRNLYPDVVNPAYGAAVFGLNNYIKKPDLRLSVSKTES